jgi:RimJ/RimL family protein N-acetyltransferase
MLHDAAAPDDCRFPQEDIGSSQEGSMTLARGDRCIETERLLLRAVAPTDLPFYTRLHADPLVAPFLGQGRARTPEESRLWLERLLRHYEEHRLGQLAVVRRSDGALLGRSGLSYYAIETAPHPLRWPRSWHDPGETPADATGFVLERELGYTFDPSAWGHGYATEAAGGVYRYARERLKLTRLISVIHADNVRSLRVAQKHGLKREDTITMFDRIFDRYVWPT